MEDFTKRDVEKLRSIIQDRQLQLSPKGLPAKPQGLDECKQGVIASAAMALVGIVLSEINEKGKFGWLSGFRIIGKLVKAINDLVGQYKACQGT